MRANARLIMWLGLCQDGSHSTVWITGQMYECWVTFYLKKLDKCWAVQIERQTNARVPQYFLSDFLFIKTNSFNYQSIRGIFSLCICTFHNHVHGSSHRRKFPAMPFYGHLACFCFTFVFFLINVRGFQNIFFQKVLRNGDTFEHLSAQSQQQYGFREAQSTGDVAFLVIPSWGLSWNLCALHKNNFCINYQKFLISK